ncbi:hypothetical protein GGR50DRAFT_645342 [Xylaria sp. CBS 124048]|nr:hypothetical protein GGR50DRAFT_645342 [Xylaria sp. CBS 124048]
MNFIYLFIYFSFSAVFCFFLFVFSPRGTWFIVSCRVVSFIFPFPFLSSPSYPPHTHFTHFIRSLSLFSCPFFSFSFFSFSFLEKKEEKNPEFR